MVQFSISLFYPWKESHDRHEGKGVVLSMDQFHKVKETCCIPCADEESDFPIFSNNKSQEEFHIACFVNDKQKDDGCTYMDFQGYVDVNDTIKTLLLKIRTNNLLDTDLLIILCLQLLNNCRMH